VDQGELGRDEPLLAKDAIARLHRVAIGLPPSVWSCAHVSDGALTQGLQDPRRTWPDEDPTASHPPAW
jgi:hypothetical protein